jgi:hypothetical protein
MKLTTHKHTAESSAPHRAALREKKIAEQIRAANAAAIHREGEERLARREAKNERSTTRRPGERTPAAGS